MDRRTIILVIGLGLLVIFWMPIMTKLGIIKPSEKPVITEQLEQSDSVLHEDYTSQPEPTAQTPTSIIEPSQELATETDSLLHVAEDSITIETNVQKIILSNYGGAPISIKLKNYNYPGGTPIEMLPDCYKSTPSIKFNGGTVNGNNYVYTSSNSQKNYTVISNDVEIVYNYNDPSGGRIIKKYRFYSDRYEYDLKIEVIDPNAMGLNRKYAIEWDNKLSPTELNVQDDYNSMWAMAMMANVRVQFDDYNNGQFSETQDGQTNWIATRSKYFASILIPESRMGAGAMASGIEAERNILGESIKTRELKMGLIMEAPYSESMIDSFTVYVGPLDYDLLKGYGDDVVDLLDIGTTPYVGWIIKIFAVPILWFLPKMYSVIPNYGLVIIIFSILVKIITWPLSKKSVKSMAAMKDLQPKMAELKEKHKKNPQALNKEMMKLYKEHGVNPLSGCLVFLPQMPLFFALFSVFRQTILLRQAPFIFWWNDLSRGALSLSDPYMILVVLMVVLMFVQQKVTMTDPKNKALIYIFPLMLGFFFYKASAGLVLYWIMFSLLSFLEQLLYRRAKSQPAVQTK